MTKRYWWVIITYIIMQFSSILFAPLLYMVLPVTMFQAIISWSIFSFIAGLIVVLFLMKPDMQRSKDTQAVDGSTMVLWSVAGVFMAFIAQGVAGAIEVYILGISQGSENTKDIMEVSRAAPLFIIIPSLVAPVLEEIIFRKIIFGALYNRTNFFIAATLSALVFGLIHGEPVHILVYASMGYVFAFLYVKTKRIIVPIIVHMAMNSLLVIAQFSIDPEDLEQMQTIFIGG